MGGPASPKSVRTAPARRAPGEDGFIAGSYTNAAGTLRYKLYRPAALRKRPPLFVMLHGGSQSAADFSTGTRMNELADECGGIVLYPEQSKFANPLGCWNWYDTRHQFADDGEPSMIAGMTRQAMADHGVDPARVYVAGMSAGGAMAVILGQAYPGLYAAVGVHSGVPSGVANDLMSGLAAMNSGPTPVHGVAAATGEPAQGHSVATIVFHGDCDSTVHPSNGEAVHAQALRRRGAAHVARVPPAGRAIRVPGGRAVTRVIQAKKAGLPGAELWIVHGGGHAWTGGSAKGSFTDENGPDASREMLRFFLQQRLSDSRGRKKAVR
jgi:poly(hydroxyalkanoate) depolymerase family esterase